MNKTTQIETFYATLGCVVIMALMGLNVTALLKYRGKKHRLLRCIIYILDAISVLGNVVSLKYDLNLSAGSEDETEKN